MFTLDLPEEITVPSEVQDTITTADPFLLRYPSQCIRSVEAVIWTQDVSQALASEKKSNLKSLWFVDILSQNSLIIHEED